MEACFARHGTRLQVATSTVEELTRVHDALYAAFGPVGLRAAWGSRCGYGHSVRTMSTVCVRSDGETGLLAILPSHPEQAAMHCLLQHQHTAPLRDVEEEVLLLLEVGCRYRLAFPDSPYLLLSNVAGNVIDHASMTQLSQVNVEDAAAALSCGGGGTHPVDQEVILSRAAHLAASAYAVVVAGEGNPVITLIPALSCCPAHPSTAGAVGVAGAAQEEEEEEEASTKLT